MILLCCMYALHCNLINNYILCIFMCAHVHVSSLVMTSFYGKIISYGMSVYVDGHS